MPCLGPTDGSRYLAYECFEALFARIDGRTLVLERQMVPAIADRHQCPAQRPRQRSGRYLLLGLAPIVVAGTAALFRATGLPSDVGNDHAFAIAMLGVLFLVSTGFYFFALQRHPAPHLLPAVWGALILLEFVVSPVHDVLVSDLLSGGPLWLDALSRACVACSLFVGGTWAGLAVATRSARVPPVDPRHRRPVHVSTGRATFLIGNFLAIGAVSQVWILYSSGALSGDVNVARGAGLIGTSLLSPLVRLSNFATLLASWLSVVATRPEHRRRFFRLALLSFAASLIVPLALSQRFGLIQALAYLAMPKWMAGMWIGATRRRVFLGLLPLLLALAFTANSITGALRGISLRGERVDSLQAVLAQAESGRGATHFRHLMLLADLIEKGIDQPNRDLAYAPFVGDMLIVLPRALFPNKPVTTMEEVNSVALGRIFRATDRGSVSVHTSSLWVQLYLLGGTWGMPVLAFCFSFGAFRLWAWSMNRPGDPRFAVVSAGMFLSFGWLAYNVVFAPMEVPGMLLAVVALSVLPLVVRSSVSPDSDCIAQT